MGRRPGGREQRRSPNQNFYRAACITWPRVLAHARHEMSARGINNTEITSVALETWESVLRSVWMTLQKRSDACDQIESLENYLIGAFHHRLNRLLKQKRRRESVLEFVPPEELTAVRTRDSVDEESVIRIHQEIQLKEVYAMMSEDVRRALVAKLYGFSWREIAMTLGTEEQNLIMRVQYAIRKIRAKLAR